MSILGRLFGTKKDTGNAQKKDKGTTLVLSADFPTQTSNIQQLRATFEKLASSFLNEAIRRYQFIQFTFEEAQFFENEPGKCVFQFDVPKSEDVLNLQKLLGELWNEIAWPDESCNQFEDLVKELIAIGRTVEDSKFSFSGYRQRAEPGHNPRARQIGQYLNKIGGFELMLKAAHRVEGTLGSGAANELSWAWHEVGDWLA